MVGCVEFVGDGATGRFVEGDAGTTAEHVFEKLAESGTRTQRKEWRFILKYGLIGLVALYFDMNTLKKSCNELL